MEKPSFGDEELTITLNSSTHGMYELESTDKLKNPAF
jgi:hypothetical protein